MRVNISGFKKIFLSLGYVNPAISVGGTGYVIRAVK